MDIDERRRFTRCILIDCRHRGDDIADVASFLTDGDEPRPVIAKQTVSSLSRNIGGGGHGDDAANLSRACGVDAHHACARVRREHDGTVQHAGQRHVIDERPAPENQIGAAISRSACADALCRGNVNKRLATAGFRHQLDGVDDLHIAGATTEMTVNRARDFCPAGSAILLQ